MSKAGLIILVIILLAIVGVGYLIATNKIEVTPPNATSTPPIVTPPPSPPQPGAPVVSTGSDTTVSNSTAVVTGSVNPNGAQTVYWYEYGRTTALGTRTSEQTIGSGFTIIPTPGYITGLSASTLYYYRLSARNSFGTVNGTTRTFTTHASNPPPPGAAPAAQSRDATDISRTSTTLNGTVDPNEDATSYWFEYGTSESLGRVTNLKSAGSGDTAQSVSIVVSGLEPAAKYFFRINAQNDFGTVNGRTLSFTTNGPPTVNEPDVETRAATAVTRTTATLNGVISANGANTTYWFEYSTNNLVGSLVGTATPDQSVTATADNAAVNADISGLTPNTRYNFRLVGRNSEGTVRGEVLNFTTNE